MTVELLNKPDICLSLETEFVRAKKDQMLSAAESLGYNHSNWIDIIKILL
jgi:hypothetical protein